MPVLMLVPPVPPATIWSVLEQDAGTSAAAAPRNAPTDALHLKKRPLMDEAMVSLSVGRGYGPAPGHVAVIRPGSGEWPRGSTPRSRAQVVCSATEQAQGVGRI